jgi:beta-glucanase (GH16 family)
MQSPIATIEVLEYRRLMSASGIATALQSILTAGSTSATVAPKKPVAKPHPPVHKKKAQKPVAKEITGAKPVAAAPVSTATSTSSSTETPPIAGTWQTVFDDEFNGTSLNPVWHTAQYWDHSVTVVGKGELEAYDASGVSVSDGQLHLTARADNQYGVPYVSGLVMTGGDQSNPAQQKFSFQYGYMEVRAQIPKGQGLWPAIWMMPAGYDDQNGEIDVMEALGGNPSQAYFTVHRLGQLEQHTIVGADLSAGFHTYGVDWEPNEITWYLDGVAVATCTNQSLIPHEPMYPIMNLAVGGNWGGPPSSTTQFPASMNVDYIRLWQSPAA